MNTKVAVMKERALMPALAMSEEELMNVLRNSLYPGAKDESIKLVIGYCKAAGLDPIKKPVHIVPMDVAVKDDEGNIKYVKRDVIMPGIGSYRAEASRTGEFAGVSEPEFGPVKKIAIQRKQYNNANRGDKTFTMVPDGEMEFPEWCKVTVKRLVGNIVAEYTAKELWLENYATAGKDSTAPNAMWKRRPYAQLAKCAEAQALRKGFSECGNQPTADEMEGKALEEVTGVTIDQVTGEITGKQKPTIPPLSDAEFEKQMPRWKAAVEAGKKDAAAIIAFVNAQNIAVLTDAQKAIINGWKKAGTEDHAEKDFVAQRDGGSKPAMSSGPAIDENDHPFD